MFVYIVRHAEALPDFIDSKRELSENGIKQARLIGERLKELSCAPVKILHSPKTRALQTATIIAKYLAPPKGTEEAEGLLPSDEISAWADKLNYEEEDLMLVGHLPHVADLTNALTRSKNANSASFDTCTVVCLEKTKAGFKRLWKISPSTLD